VRNYDTYINHILDRGKSMKELNVSYLKGVELAAKRLMSAMNPASDRNMRIGGFVGKFGERVLHSWNILGTVRELMIRRDVGRGGQYPSKGATKETSDATDEGESLDLEELMPLALANCRRFVPGWQQIQAHEVKISVVTGGLTNRLYKVSISPELAANLTPVPSSTPSGSTSASASSSTDADLGDSGGSSADVVPHQLLFRVYGAGTENFFNRENEHRIFKHFSDSGMGPKLYGIFEGGRIEEFLSLHSLEQHDLPKLAPLIAEKIATMHASQMDGLPMTPSLFDSLWTWIRTAEDVSFPDDPTKQAMLDSLKVKEKLTTELHELQRELLALESPVYFCHNDLLGGNIMYDEETQRLCFIDYEYGSYNFRGFDIGNHFCERSIKYGIPEHPFFKLDSKKYPNKRQQRLFFTSYLTQYHISTGQPPEVSEEEIAKLTKEVNAFALAAHFLWGIWAIIQASTSDIEFGYLEFSKARFDMYYAKKHEYLYGKPASEENTVSTSGDEAYKSDEEEGSFTELPSHKFEESHFNSPTWCGHCKRFVYQPFGKQGYRCMACNMKVHRGCVNKVTSRCLSPHPSSMWPIVEL
jgi:choline/ethanolamine kinase